MGEKKSDFHITFLTDWPTDRLTDLLIPGYKMTHWLTDWLTTWISIRLTNWLTDWLNNQLTGLPNWLPAWLTLQLPLIPGWTRNDLYKATDSRFSCCCTCLHFPVTVPHCISLLPCLTFCAFSLNGRNDATFETARRKIRELKREH